ncbi:MAG: hypothetical protein IJ300_05100 [Clostridia bacterium]|nr:hypothetical protein [Clostridia bacterium]
MKEAAYPFLLKRTIETILLEIIISFFGVTLVNLEIVPMTYSAYVKLILVLMVVKSIITWRFLEGYILGVRDTEVYLRVNILVYVIITAIVLIMALLKVEPVYTYLFFVYKLIRYVGYSRAISAAFVSLFNFALVILMPFVYSRDLMHQI